VEYKVFFYLYHGYNKNIPLRKMHISAKNHTKLEKNAQYNK